MAKRKNADGSDAADQAETPVPPGSADPDNLPEGTDLDADAVRAANEAEVKERARNFTDPAARKAAGVNDAAEAEARAARIRRK